MTTLMWSIGKILIIISKPYLKKLFRERPIKIDPLKNYIFT